MKALKPIQIAWLLPVTLLAHQVEEYFGEFPQWYSDLLNAQLSIRDFLIINGIGLFLITVFALSYLFNKHNMALVAVGTLVFVNGIVHLLLTIFTFSYSPGTISGIVLFLPLGTIIYRRILPQLPENERIIAISIGIIALFSVSVIAMNV